jgi:tetratricopeptide (TPR) repeat protein
MMTRFYPYERNQKQFAVGIVVVPFYLFLTAGLSFAQEKMVPAPAGNAQTPSQDVIESDVDFENFNEGKVQVQSKPILERFEKPAASATGSGQLEIKEDEIININRSLKKIIEENKKLEDAKRQLDGELRQLRGQHNIDANRLNTLSVERDAYKSQNDVMSGLTQKYAQDIEDLKKQLQEKDTQMATISQQAAAEPAVEKPEEIGLGTIQVTKEEREKGQDILMMLDQVKRKGEKLKTDEARVHYNMGNMFFKQKEYNRAKSEFETALRLMPHDASAHFNLALVSSQYLNDYRAAMVHFREYLELNPTAEDAPLVREKIIEAELYLRSEIPSALEKQVNEEKRRGF